MPPSYANRDLLRYSANELLRVLCYHIALDGLKCNLKPLLEIERPKVDSIALFFPQKNTKPFIVFYNDVMDLLAAPHYVPERKPMLVEATHQVADESTEVQQKMCCAALEKIAEKDGYLVSALLHCQGFSPTLSIAGLLRIADQNDFKHELARWKSYREIDELTRENAALTREADQWIAEKASRDLHVHHLMLANSDLASKLNLLTSANVALQQQIGIREMATVNAQRMCMRRISELIQQVKHMEAHGPRLLSFEWTEEVRTVLGATHEIQRWFRYIKELRRATLRVQTWFRKCNAMTLLLRLRQENSIDRVARSATHVQRRVRGSRCVRWYGTLRAAALRLQTAFRQTQQRKAAATLQPIVRGFLARRRLAAQAKAVAEAKVKAEEEARAAEAKAEEEARAAEAEALAAKIKAEEEARAAEAKAAKSSKAKAAKAKAAEAARAKAAKAAQLEAESKANRQAEAKLLKEIKEERHRKAQLLREETKHRVVAEQAHDRTAKQIREMSDEEIMRKQFLVKDITSVDVNRLENEMDILLRDVLVIEEVGDLETLIDTCLDEMLSDRLDFFSLDVSNALQHLVDKPGIPITFHDPNAVAESTWTFLMMIMQFDHDGPQFKMYTHAFWKGQTLALNTKAKCDLQFVITMMKRLPSNPYLMKYIRHIIQKNLARPTSNFDFIETTLLANIYLEKLNPHCQEVIDLFLYVAQSPHVACMGWFSLEDEFVQGIYLQCEIKVSMLKHMSKTVDAVPTLLLERIVKDTDMMVECDETMEAVKMLAKLKRPLVSFTDKMLYSMTRCLLSPNYIKLLFVCLFLQLSNEDVADVKSRIIHYETSLRLSYVRNYSDQLALLLSYL